ncbi:MAG TPA: hypothetical protein VEK38_03255 [Candidatus Bathyarchaeia archaeon]|nr:hypothetical protein [Candidatus Bathyarchaeia archaeon]
MSIFSTKNISAVVLFTSLFSMCSEQISSLPLAKLSVNPAYWTFLEWANDKQQVEMTFKDYLNKRNDNNLVFPAHIEFFAQKLENNIKNKEKSIPPIESFLYHGNIPYYFILNMPETITLKNGKSQSTTVRLQLFSTSTLMPTTKTGITEQLKYWTESYKYTKNDPPLVFNDNLELVPLS